MNIVKILLKSIETEKKIKNESIILYLIMLIKPYYVDNLRIRHHIIERFLDFTIRVKRSMINCS